MWDYDALTALAVNYPASAVLLSGQTVVLILAALQTMEYGGLWESGIAPLTTVQEDNRDKIVAQAEYEVQRGGYSAVSAGATMAYAGATIPTGWLECTGAVVLRADYPNLFAAIGTTWNTGGEPANAFRLPDLRGRGVVGSGTGTGLTSRVIGVVGGEETHLLTTPEIPAHTHDVPRNGTVNSPSLSHLNIGTQTDVNWQQTATRSTGGGGAHNNMQPFAVLKWIIATGEV